MRKRLKYPVVQCLSCGEFLVSEHVHDHKMCKCKNQTMIDGGNDYLRYGGHDIQLVRICRYQDEVPTIYRE